MAETQQPTESLNDFKNSFFCGSRGDLAFKFLKNLAPEWVSRLSEEEVDAVLLVPV